MIGYEPPLKIDKDRMRFDNMTSCYVRAQNKDGRWLSVDIACLELLSLLHWLRSRGGKNHMAEVLLAVILEHPRQEIDKCYTADGEQLELIPLPG